MEGVQLTPSAKSLKKSSSPSSCCICGVDERQKKIYGTDNGRKKLTEAFKACDDNELLKELEKVSEFFYHLDCYKKYCLKAERTKKKGKIALAFETNVSDSNEAFKRRHSGRQKRDGDWCVICGNKKYKGDIKLLRICEKDRAEKFLVATHYFQDEVFSRTSTLDDINSVFAADILYHSACMSHYLIKYSRHKEEFDTLVHDTTVKNAFQILLDTIDFAQN